MNDIRYNVFKDGKTKAVTFSYDDGRINDIRLAELFKKYNLKATFNLNSSNLGKPNYITAEQVKKISDDGFEIAVHTVTHPFLETLPDDQIFAEIFNDRLALEAITGKIINGMAYPYGTFDERVKRIAKSAGINYSRTTRNQYTCIPGDFLEWPTTCHHKDLPSFLDETYNNIGWRLYIVYVWGHSYEFVTEEDWQTFEDCLKTLAFKDDTWYATNGEICDYVNAQRELKFSADFTKVFNKANFSVWIMVNGKTIEIKPGYNEL